MKLLKKLTVFLASVLMAFTVMSVTGCNKGGTKILNDGSLQLQSFEAVKEENNLTRKEKRRNDNAVVEECSYYALLNDEQPTLVAIVKNDKNLVFFEMDIQIGETVYAFTPWANNESNKVTVDKDNTDGVWTTKLYIQPSIAIDAYDAKETIRITNIVFFDVSNVEVSAGDADKYGKVGAYIDSATKAVTFYKYVGPDSTAIFIPKDSDGKPGMLEYGIKYDAKNERYVAAVSANYDYEGKNVKVIDVPEKVELDILTEDSAKNNGVEHIEAVVIDVKRPSTNPFKHSSAFKFGSNVLSRDYELYLPDTLEEISYEVGFYNRMVENDIYYIGSKTNKYLVAYMRNELSAPSILTLNKNTKVIYGNLFHWDDDYCLGFEFSGTPVYLSVTDDKQWVLSKDGESAYAYLCGSSDVVTIPETVKEFKGDFLFECSKNKTLRITNEEIIPELERMISKVEYYHDDYSSTFYNNWFDHFGEVAVPFGTLAKFNTIFSYGYDSQYGGYAGPVRRTREYLGESVGKFVGDYGIVYELYNSGYAAVVGYEDYVANGETVSAATPGIVIRIPEKVLANGTEYEVRQVLKHSFGYAEAIIVFPGTINYFYRVQERKEGYDGPSTSFRDNATAIFEKSNFDSSTSNLSISCLNIYCVEEDFALFNKAITDFTPHTYTELAELLERL